MHYYCYSQQRLLRPPAISAHTTHCALNAQKVPCAGPGRKSALCICCWAEDHVRGTQTHIAQPAAVNPGHGRAAAHSACAAALQTGLHTAAAMCRRREASGAAWPVGAPACQRSRRLNAAWPLRGVQHTHTHTVPQPRWVER